VSRCGNEWRRWQDAMPVHPCTTPAHAIRRAVARALGHPRRTSGKSTMCSGCMARANLAPLPPLPLLGARAREQLAQRVATGPTGPASTGLRRRGHQIGG
jgi:hypothetical protein